MYDQDWLRMQFFGPQPSPTGCCALLPAHVMGLATQAGEIGDELLGPDASGDGVGAALDALVAPARTALQALPSPFEVSDRGGLTVALMGRTTAGKSTILEALTQGDGSRQGRGAQRTTRSVHRAPASELPDVVLVDTPGVGAHDGQADFEAAFAQVPEADLILWVAANDSQQEETTRALRMLALQGKPIVMALNCRYPIDALDGALNDNGQTFLQYPELAFDEADDHARVLARHMAAAGVAQVAVVPVHARAAYLSTTGIAQAEELRRVSRVDDLVKMLSEHRQSASQVQLRALRSADRVREPVTSARVSLVPAIVDARSMIHRQRETVMDAHRRMRRALDREEARLTSELAKPIDARRRWHLMADPGKGVQDAWKAEADTLGQDLVRVFDDAASRMQKAMDEALDQTLRDWSDVPLPDLDDVSFTSFDSVIWNRIAKGGAAVAISAAVAGAVRGAAAGAGGGPLGAAVGALAGFVIGGVGSWVMKAVGNLFKSKDRVLRERREQLGEALKPKLDSLDQSARAEAATRADNNRAAGKEWLRTALAHLAEADRRVARWEELDRRLGVITAALDLATAQALLEATGRTRAAQGAVRAVRGPSALAVEMTEPAFSEVALFPVLPSPVSIVVAPEHSSRTPGQALNLMAQLTPDQVRCLAISPDAVRIEVRGPDLADGVLDSFESMLRDFTGSRVTLVRARSAAAGRGSPGRDMPECDSDSDTPPATNVAPGLPADDARNAA